MIDKNQYLRNKTVRQFKKKIFRNFCWWNFCFCLL